MALSQAELDRLFPPPLVPHCEGCHPYGEKAAETFLDDPETGTRMACDSGAPHTHKLCRRHINGAEMVISTGSGRAAGGDPYGRSTEELTGKPWKPWDDSWSLQAHKGPDGRDHYGPVDKDEKCLETAPGEDRQAAPGDRPEGASPPHPIRTRERGWHWAPSAPQSPVYRRLFVGICETHHDRAKSGAFQVMVQYPVKSENCTACQLEVVVALKNEIAVLVYQRNVAQDEASTSQKELAEVRAAYLEAERACHSLREMVAERDEWLKRLRKRKRKAKVKKKRGARR